jgi:ketosteroid isomerase-like protein
MPTDDDTLAIVLRLYEAFARRDLPTRLALLDPDVERSEPAKFRA